MPVRFLLGLLLVSGFCPQAPSSGGDCFPQTAGLTKFEAEWYCRQLAAAGEETLREGLRFSYVPSFHPTRVVRIYVANGVPVVIGKVLTGQGGYDPGHVARTTKRTLTPDEWRLLQQRLENADAWGIPTKDDRLGLDGARWIFEGFRNGQYHRHVVWSPGPDFPQFHKAGAYMLELAGLLPAADELY